jgi:NADPH2:quinone reductase
VIEMTKAVRVHQVGGPEVLTYEDVEVGPPGNGEVRIRQHAVGLNFIDVYFRTGLYKAPGLPFIAGNEAAGEVLAVGPGVTNFHPGDRVAYYSNLGGYASERVIPADKLVKLPDHITYEQGAVLMLKGLTVWYLLHKTFKVEQGHRVLIHAAAGGIGLLACQWARGARCACHRHRRLEGQGRSRARQWLRSRHPLQRGELRRARQADQPRRALRRGL